MNNRKVAFLGGDRRMVTAAKYVAARGFFCTIWGMNEEWDTGDCLRCEEWKEALYGAGAVVLPMPVSEDGVRLFCPGIERINPPRIQTLFENLESSVSVSGGRITESIVACAERCGISVNDYFSCEELQIRNAVPTAEAAVLLALQMMDVTIRDSRCAVIGFGRIGKYLAGLLRDMGASVTVAARKNSDLALASSTGLDCIKILEKESDHGLDTLTKGFDLIVNTVPARLINRELIGKMSTQTVIIDIASVPGGVDMQAAAEAGIKAEWGLALPGRFFPESAGIIIGKTVLEMLEKK